MITFHVQLFAYKNEDLVLVIPSTSKWKKLMTIQIDKKHLIASFTQLKTKYDAG